MRRKSPVAIARGSDLCGRGAVKTFQVRKSFSDRIKQVRINRCISTVFTIFFLFTDNFGAHRCVLRVLHIIKSVNSVSSACHSFSL